MIEWFTAGGYVLPVIKIPRGPVVFPRPECPTCKGRRMVTLYAGVITHPYGRLEVNREIDIYDDFPPGGQFYGWSWTAPCPDCR